MANYLESITPPVFSCKAKKRTPGRWFSRRRRDAREFHNTEGSCGRLKLGGALAQAISEIAFWKPTCSWSAEWLADHCRLLELAWFSSVQKNPSSGLVFLDIGSRTCAIEIFAQQNTILSPIVATKNRLM